MLFHCQSIGTMLMCTSLYVLHVEVTDGIIWLLEGRKRRRRPI